MLLLLLLPFFASAAEQGITAQAQGQIIDSFTKTIESGAYKELLPAGKNSQISFLQLTEDDAWIMGIMQLVRVKAPAQKLELVFTDVPGYLDLFQDLVASKIIESKGPNEFVAYAESEIPMPFVPNDKTTVRYKKRAIKNSSLYDFSLVEGNHVKEFAGMVAILDLGPQESLYMEVDFIKAGFGIVRTIPAKEFWSENGKANLQADWAMKLRAENPQLTGKEIKKNSLDYAKENFKEIKNAYDHAERLKEYLVRINPTAPVKQATANSPEAPKPSTANPKANGPTKEPKP